MVFPSVFCGKRLEQLFQLRRLSEGPQKSESEGSSQYVKVTAFWDTIDTGQTFFWLDTVSLISEEPQVCCTRSTRSARRLCWFRHSGRRWSVDGLVVDVADRPSLRMCHRTASAMVVAWRRPAVLAVPVWHVCSRPAVVTEPMIRLGGVEVRVEDDDLGGIGIRVEQDGLGGIKVVLEDDGATFLAHNDVSSIMA